jgi:radical SAM superfamily enzyme YgiQ (UPF0313 family)
MLIRFIAPRFSSYCGLKDVYKQQKLTLTYLAALTPKEYEVEIVDEDYEEIDFSKKVDLVGITLNSVTSVRAYEIADIYKKMNIPVILGGFHASLFPKESLKRCDAVVIGEAEYVWEQVLNDFKSKNLKKIYKSEKLCDLKNIVYPRYELYRNENFFNQYPVFVTRGCPYKCSYCCIKAVYGKTYRKRPIEDVVKQIEYIKSKFNKPGPIPLTICFIDDNLWGDLKYAKELFAAIKPLNIKWFVQGASLNISRDLLEPAADSGCDLAFIGLESLNKENLKYLDKDQNDVEKYEDYIKLMHELKISIGAYFMVGLPYDTEDVFIKMKDFLERNSIEFPTILIYTPIPGSEEFKKQKWYELYEYNEFNKINDLLPVYYPDKMNKTKFRESFVKFMREIFSDESMKIRLKYCNNPGYKMMNKTHQIYYNQKEWDEWVFKAQ